MTKPENIEQAFSGMAYPVDAATGKNPTIEAVKVALRRLLCPLPEKGAWYAPRDECPSASVPIPPGAAPPPSPSPDATEKGGDRAAEMAEMLITPFISAPDGKADSRHVSIGMGHDGTLVRPSVRTCDNALAAIRNVLADALRAYGDELLEKAAFHAMEVAKARGGPTSIGESILALKSSATKGVANG